MCGVAKIERQAFQGKVRDREVSREVWRWQLESDRVKLIQQLESANEQNRHLEKRLAALSAEQKESQLR